MPRTRSLAWSELKIGLIAVVAVVIATVLIFLLSGEGGFFWQRYSLKTVFPDVAGLKPMSRARSSTSAYISGKSPGCIGSRFFVAGRPSACSSVSIGCRRPIG